MSPACELCGHAGATRDLYPRLGIVRCPHCSLVSYAGDVDPLDIYTTGYFTDGEYRDYLADRAPLERNFRRRVEHLRKIKPAGRLLEIGSAYGFFLELACAHWDVQ